MHVTCAFIIYAPLTFQSQNFWKKEKRMQQSKEQDTTSSAADETQRRLREAKVGDVTADKRRLVEVPYTASLAHTMNALVANKVVAVPVAAPPGKWIGAGGSMIMESDKQTGAVRKHYIGMLTMLDILAHIAGDDKMNGGDDGGSDLDKKMSAPVSSIIGHCLEGLSLWTLNPNTSILDCMEVFSKGIHRALVPTDGQMEHISGVELVESASSYHMLTQMDLLRFLMNHAYELEGTVSHSVQELGVVNENVFAITEHTKVVDVIRCMRAALLQAVPIVKSSSALEEDPKKLINGKGRQLIGTFSATDIRGCHCAALQTWLPLTALEFTQVVSTTPLLSASNTTQQRELVTCQVDSPFSEVINKALTKHVHRVWVVDQRCSLVGLVSLTDMIRVLRALMLADFQ